MYSGILTLIIDSFLFSNLFLFILSGLNDEVNAVVIPPSLMGVFNDPHLDHSNTVIQYISDTYGNANTVMATVEASNFDPTKVQWA